MPHIHEKIDFVASVYIVNGDAVLLRVHDKLGMWLPPGGHIELDEDPTETAVREAREEVGLEVELVGDIAPSLDQNDRELLVPRFMNRHQINATHEHINLNYFGRSGNREIFQGERELSDHIKWFTREELEDPHYGVSPQVRLHARAALDALAI